MKILILSTNDIEGGAGCGRWGADIEVGWEAFMRH